jgi:hypothetical protein
LPLKSARLLRAFHTLIETKSADAAVLQPSRQRSIYSRARSLRPSASERLRASSSVRRLAAAIGLALHPSGGPGQQHPVMSHSQDLRDAVRGDLVDDEVAGLADSEFHRHQPSCRPEVEYAQAFDPWDIARAGTGRGRADGIHRGKHQPVIAGSGFETPFPSALEQDAVDFAFCGSGKSVVVRH